jgi:hypothetical protein
MMANKYAGENSKISAPGVGFAALGWAYIEPDRARLSGEMLDRRFPWL